MNSAKSSAARYYLLRSQRQLVEVLQNESLTTGLGGRNARLPCCIQTDTPSRKYGQKTVDTVAVRHSIFWIDYFQNTVISPKPMKETGWYKRRSAQPHDWLSDCVLAFRLRAGY